MAGPKRHHVREEGVAFEAEGLELKGRQAVRHRQLRSDRRRQLWGHVARWALLRHAQGLMRFPSTGVMCVWNVVNGMQFTSANKRTLMRSFSGLAASSSHFATASVMRFKPSPLDQFCRDTFCFLALGCSAEAAACSGGSLAAGAASGFLGAAFRPAFDDVFEGRPASGLRLEELCYRA